MWKWLLALPVIASTAFAQERPSAYEALRVVGTQLGRASMNHVVSVTGINGSPQPRTWKIILEDRRVAAGFREIEVGDGQMMPERGPVRSVIGSSENATIKTSQLNLDSSGAYAVARHTAETSHTVFTLVSYTLRADHRGNPTWIVTLHASRFAPVGTIHIAANKGTVTRVEGMYSGANMAQVETDKTNAEPSDEEAADGDDNLVTKDIKRMFRRTKKEAIQTFGRVQHSFEDFFYRR